ncbi:uncharacterized protein [Magallana gigas]|uniref:uncharacterized protein n=1 Tax=Magallana gigas TaxID=29159 RepID=UPI003341DAAF
MIRAVVSLRMKCSICRVPVYIDLTTSRRRGDTVPKETGMEMERRRLQERERGRQPLPPPQMGPPPRAAPCPAPPQMGPPPRAAPCPAHPVAPTPPPARGGGRYHLRPAKRPRTD